MQKLEVLVLVAMTSVPTASQLRGGYENFFADKSETQVSLASMCAILKRMVDAKLIKSRKAKPNEHFSYPVRVKAGAQVYTLTKLGEQKIQDLSNFITIYKLRDN